jgi:single-strand DNA-binding protein
MASYNKVILMGNLTRDIELRYTQSNQAVATIGLAVNRQFRTADGQMKEEVCFVDCDAWGKTAETMSKYLSKGRPVFIEGRLRLDQWQDKEGQKHSRLKVVIENFKFIDSKPGGAGDGPSPRPVVRTAGNGAPAPAAAPTPADGPAYEPIQEEDIPF